MNATIRILLPFEDEVLAFPEGDVLCIRPVALPPEFREIGGLICEQGFKPFADQLEAEGYTVLPKVSGQFDTVIVYLGRNRAENLGNIARGYSMARETGTVLVDGAKTDGVDSILKTLRKLVDIDGVYSKAHGKVFWMKRGAAPQEFFAWQQALNFCENADGYQTAPGMFSAEKVDKGSALLTQYLDGSVKGRVADIGAGWGYLSVEILRASEKITELDLFEAEHVALEASKLNVTDSRARFHWTDVAKLAHGREGYHTVISNPPFHQSRAADPLIGGGFIAAASRILRPSGQFLFVANRQLPYEAVLEARFRHWEILFQDGAFKVIRARKPKSER